MKRSALEFSLLLALIGCSSPSDLAPDGAAQDGAVDGGAALDASPDGIPDVDGMRDAAMADGSADSDPCVDPDNDGAGPGCALGPDCAPRDPEVHPGAAEVCDGVDNDCSGEVDEGCECVADDTRACGESIGLCSPGTQSCTDGVWGECAGATVAVAERCDGELDEDCDGLVDEGCACVDGTSRSCGSDTGVCASGNELCVSGAWGACEGAVVGSDELCDGEDDDDCDGIVDEGCMCVSGMTRACGSDEGACMPGEQRCLAGTWGGCEGAVLPSDEACDGVVDDDCDGDVDEGCECVNGARRACGIDVGACELGEQLCGSGAWGPCMGEVLPETESCSASADEDCDGVIDEGCAPPHGAEPTFSRRVLLGGGTEPVDLSTGDIDGDGRAELLLVDHADDVLRIFPNQSAPGSLVAASFGAPQSFATAAEPHALAVGDVDGDGHPDVVVVHAGAGGVHVYRNTGAGAPLSASSLEAPVSIALTGPLFEVLLVDVDQDGALDVCATRSDRTDGKLSILRNTSTSGSISFALPFNLDTASNALGIGAGDGNGDGAVDLVVGRGLDSIATYRNVSTPGGLDLVRSIVPYSSGGNSFSVGFTDFDGDSLAEVVSLGPRVSDSSARLSIHRSTGTVGGPLSHGSAFTMLADQQYGGLIAASADMNNDGLTDVVASVLNYGSQGFRVYQYAPNADGDLRSEDFVVGALQRLEMSGGFFAPLTVADLDGDGFVDVVVASTTSGQVSVVRNISGD